MLPRLNENNIEPRGNARRRGKPCACTPQVQGECDGHVILHHTHHQLRGWGSDNTWPVTLLLQDFFRYFGRQFEWDQHLVSVTRHGTVSKKTFAFHEGQHTGLCIQDPLDPFDNCARSVGPGAAEKILDEFKRAHALGCGAVLQQVREVGFRLASNPQRNALKQVRPLPCVRTAEPRHVNLPQPRKMPDSPARRSPGGIQGSFPIAA